MTMRSRRNRRNRLERRDIDDTRFYKELESIKRRIYDSSVLLVDAYERAEALFDYADTYMDAAIDSSLEQLLYDLMDDSRAVRETYRSHFKR